MSHPGLHWVPPCLIVSLLILSSCKGSQRQYAESSHRSSKIAASREAHAKDELFFETFFAINSTNCCALNGFVKKSVMPALKQSSLSVENALAVIACQRQRDLAAVGRRESAGVQQSRRPPISGAFLLFASYSGGHVPLGCFALALRALLLLCARR